MLKKLLKSKTGLISSSTPRDKRKIEKKVQSNLIFKQDDLSIDICEQTFDNLEHPTENNNDSVQIQESADFLSESEFDPLDTSSFYGGVNRKFSSDSSISISSVDSEEQNDNSATNNPLPQSFNNENDPHFNSNYVRFEELLEERLAHIETIKEYHRLKEEYLQLRKDKYRLE